MNLITKGMHSNILMETEGIKVTLLPRIANSGKWSTYVSSEKDITVCAGDFGITELHAGYPYSHLKSIFHVINFLAIEQYLDQNKFLYNVLFEIEAAIRKCFSEENLRLELYEDPEGEMEDQLAISIMTYDEPQVALAKLGEFDKDFWLNKIDQFGEFVSVNLRYL